MITAGRACQLDAELYRAVGLEPSDAHIVVVMSAGGYRGIYEPFAHRCIDVETTGPPGLRLERLPFGRIERPMFPFDRDFDWTPIVHVPAVSDPPESSNP